jgi:hypothetical protein
MISPYAATKIVNRFLTEAGLNPIPPQMMYQYSKKGYILSTRDESGKIRFDETGTDEKDFGPWLVKYLTKKGITVVDEEVNENQLTLEDA